MKEKAQTRLILKFLLTIFLVFTALLIPFSHFGGMQIIRVFRVGMASDRIMDEFKGCSKYLNLKGFAYHPLKLDACSARITNDVILISEQFKELEREGFKINSFLYKLADVTVYTVLEAFDAKAVRYLAEFGEFQSTSSGKMIVNLLNDATTIGKTLRKWGITSAFHSKLDDALAKHGESLKNISKRLFTLKKILNEISTSLKGIHEPNIKTTSSNKILSAIFPHDLTEITEAQLKTWSNNFSQKRLYIDGGLASNLEVMGLAKPVICRQIAKEKGFSRKYYMNTCRKISIAVKQIMPYLMMGESESFEFLLKMPFRESNEHSKFWQKFLLRIGMLTKREASRGYHPKTFFFFLELSDGEEGYKKTRRLLPKFLRAEHWATKWLMKQKKEDLLHWKR